MLARIQRSGGRRTAVVEKRGPTLRGQWLGQQLRERREAAKLTLKDAAEYLQRDASTVSRFESGVYPVRRGDLLALLDLYNVSHQRERDELFRLSEEVWQTGWWDRYAKDVDRQFAELPWLEARAERICSYHAMVVPGIMQTRAYAEVWIQAVEGPTATDEEIGRWVDLRMTRQQMLEGEQPTRMCVILEEWVLRRPIGGPEVMRGQLERIVDLGRHATVEVRVLPTSVGPHAGREDGFFVVFEMPEPYPDVAYLETLAGSLYVETPGVERFAAAYDRLHRASLGPEESAELISAIAEEFR
jgi:transcriptional regulator with XRE-family HTH domain